MRSVLLRFSSVIGNIRNNLKCEERPKLKPNHFIFRTVFLVTAHSDVFRRMVLLARNIGMEPGEYVFIFFVVLKTDPLLGDFSWRRGDNFDVVSVYLFMIINISYMYVIFDVYK